MGYAFKEGQFVRPQLIGYCDMQRKQSKGNEFALPASKPLFKRRVPRKTDCFKVAEAYRGEVLQLSTIIRCSEGQCSWEGCIREWEEEHSLVCAYMLVVCTKCNSSVLRSYLEQHQGVCPARQISCQYCGREMPLDMMQHHWESCSEFYNERYGRSSIHSFPVAQYQPSQMQHKLHVQEQSALVIGLQVPKPPLLSTPASQYQVEDDGRWAGEVEPFGILFGIPNYKRNIRVHIQC